MEAQYIVGILGAGAGGRLVQDNKGLNTLVVMDEAHRLAPRDIPPEEEETKAFEQRSLTLFALLENMASAGCSSAKHCPVYTRRFAATPNLILWLRVGSRS